MARHPLHFTRQVLLKGNALGKNHVACVERRETGAIKDSKEERAQTAFVFRTLLVIPSVRKGKSNETNVGWKNMKHSLSP